MTTVSLLRSARALVAIAAALLASAGFAQTAAQPAATVEFLQAPVSIIAVDGRSREARLHEPIFAGETVVTGALGELHALTADHGYIAVRPDTRTTIKELRANGDDNDSMTLELLKGTLRLVSGWIGKHNARNYAVNTPTATIGIRGTDHEPSYFPPEEHREGVEPGTYEKVNAGATVLRNAAGQVAVEAGESAFASHTGSHPAKLARIPGFYRPSGNEARVDERKVAVEANQETARTRRATEVKQRESREKTTSQSESGQKDSSAKSPSESATQKPNTDNAAGSRETGENKQAPKAESKSEEADHHPAQERNTRRERRRPNSQ